MAAEALLNLEMTFGLGEMDSLEHLGDTMSLLGYQTYFLGKRRLTAFVEECLEEFILLELIWFEKASTACLGETSDALESLWVILVSLYGKMIYLCFSKTVSFSTLILLDSSL